MRLWHYKLIPYLPRTQLLAQWRELNSIFKKQDNHILINYIYKWDKSMLYNYSKQVVCEMRNRNYKIKSFDNMNNYFKDIGYHCWIPTYTEHDLEYLTICYYNLKEKYLRGQKDITSLVWRKIEDLYRREVREKSDA